MSQYPLSIVGLGIISCLGEGAEVNAAAMRCDYDGFQETDFNQPFNVNKQIGAPIEGNLRGIEKLSYMSTVAVSEAIKNLPNNYQGLNVIYCMPDKNLNTFFNTDEALHEIIDSTFKKMQLGKLSSTSTVFWQQRCGFISALKRSQELLYDEKLEFVLIVSIDSLLNSATLSDLGGELFGENRRLLGDEFSDGFVPGEAATAVLLSTPQRMQSKVIISGVGEGFESATIDNEEEVLKGKGLSDAIKSASQQAGIEVHDTNYRVSSVSGELYFFKEAALALTASLKQKVPENPLLHPADNIGEVGAAVGGAMVVMDYFSLIKGYAPGNTSLHLISNDNSYRGAFIMQYKTTKRGT